MRAIRAVRWLQPCSGGGRWWCGRKCYLEWLCPECAKIGGVVRYQKGNGKVEVIKANVCGWATRMQVLKLCFHAAQRDGRTPMTRASSRVKPFIQSEVNKQYTISNPDVSLNWELTSTAYETKFDRNCCVEGRPATCSELHTFAMETRVPASLYP